MPPTINEIGRDHRNWRRLSNFSEE